MSEEQNNSVKTPEVVETQPVETSGETKTTKKGKRQKSKTRKVLEWVFTGIFAAFFVFFAIGQLTGMIHRKDNYNQTLTYGHGAFVITTNSMEPEYKVGTAIITYKDSAVNIVKNFDAGKHVDITFYSAYVANNSKYDYPLYRPGNISYGGIDYKLEGHEPVYPSSNVTPIITHRLIDYHLEESRELGKGRYTFVVAGINTEGQLSKEGQYQLLTENELLGVVRVNSPILGGLFRFIISPWGLLVFLMVPAFYLVVTSVIDIFRALKESEEAEAGGSSGDDSSSTNSSLDGLSKEDRQRLKQDLLDQMLNKKGDGDGK